MAEFKPPPRHEQQPVTADLDHLHAAGLPGSPREAALQRNHAALSPHCNVSGPGGGNAQRGQQHGEQGAGGGSHAQEAERILPDWERSGVWGGMGCQDSRNRLLPVPVYQARVLVSLRPSVLDPAGEATRAAAARLGVDGVRRLRIGKAIDVELEAPDADIARAQLEMLGDRLLANPVIEDWRLEFPDAG